MSVVVLPNTITPNTPASATEVQANFDAIATIVNGNLDSANLKDDAVTASKLADDAVGTINVSNGAITTDKLAAASVTAAKIASKAVGVSLLADGAVTTAKLTDDSVTQAKIADSAVGSSQLASGAVTSGKVGNTAVDTANLVAGAVTPDKTSFLPQLTSSSEGVFVGRVKADGSATTLPAGWTSSKLSTGVYTITFTGSGTYVALACVNTNSANMIDTVQSTSSFVVEIYDANETREDKAFSFIVVFL